jgi:glutamyl-tRNA synthetase
VQARGVKPNQVFQPVRVALAGLAISPGIFETLVVLGRDEALARIDRALAG